MAIWLSLLRFAVLPTARRENGIGPFRITPEPWRSDPTMPQPSTIAASPTAGSSNGTTLSRISTGRSGLIRMMRLSSTTAGSHRKLDQLDAAIQDFDQAIQLDPNDAVAFALRGAAWQRKGELDRAIQDYDRALEIDPNDATTLYNRGAANAGRRQWDQAIQDYDRAIKLEPKFAPALYSRGVAKEQLGDRAGAEADIAAAKQIDPDIGKW